MKKEMKGSLSTSLVVSGLLLSNLASATMGVYDPGAVAAMPQDTINFVNRLNNAGAQAAYLSSLPNSSRGMRGLENYYRNRQEYFLEALNSNLTLLSQASDLVLKAARTGGPDGKGISECLANGNSGSYAEKKEWDEITKSFLSLGQLRQYAESGGTATYPGMDKPVLNQNVVNAYTKVSAALDLSQVEGSFWQPVDSCCTRLGKERTKYEVCNEEYITSKLSILNGIKKLPSNFVDPMNPGLYAPTLTPEDIVNLMSLGQMQDFIHAKDFNSQIVALQDADARCVNAREEAVTTLNKRGEMRSLVQTAIPALQCSLGNLLRNSGKTVRQIGFGLVNAKIPVFNSVSQCSEETKQAAATTLFYSPEAFKSDFEHLVSLPTNMLQSQPMAKPLEVYERDGLLALDLRDEAGFTREMLYITDEINPQFAQMQATAAKQAMGQSAMQVVKNNTIVPDGTTQTGRVSGRSLVNGVGAARGNSERVLVRSLATKVAEGDLESARSLAGAVRGRKNELKENIKKASSDRALITNRKDARATEARGAVTRALVQESVAETSKAFGRQMMTLKEAIGLSSDSGRVVERPGGNSGSSSSSGSNVTSNLPDYADRAAAAAYKEEQSKKAITQIRSKIRTMGNNVVELAKKVNEFVVKKIELQQEIAMMADANTFKKIGDAGFDDRADVIIKRQEEIVRKKKEFYALNAQELGARAVFATAKSSMLSYIEGAKAFQGLDVRQGNIAARSPASVQQPMVTQQQQTNLFQMPNIPSVNGASNLAPNMTPPGFNPTPTQNTGYSNLFPKWMELFTLPLAQAQSLSPLQKRERLIKEFDAFIKSYNEYSERVAGDVVRLKQEAWERFILNEREMRKEPLLSGQERSVLGAFNDALREEVPDLVKAKVSGNLAAGNSQLYQYIDQIRADSAELNELMIKEANLANEIAPKNILQDDEVWTGLLPAIALD